MNWRDVYDSIENGECDDTLHLLTEAITNRRDELNKEKRSDMSVGTRVKFNDRVTPKYMNGATGKVTRVLRKRVMVKLDKPQGRFGDEVKCPLAILDVV